MVLETSELAARVIEHLLEIGAGRCSITSEMIAGHEGDLATCEILTGLLYLHEDLLLRDRQRAEAEEELRHVVASLEEKKATAERLAAELQEAKETAEAATAAKSQFLAHMSHEIRTPLTALLGFSDLLLERDLNDSARLNYSLIVRRNGEHLLSLINNILDLSKIEAGELGIERIDCSLAQILADVASLTRARAAAQDLSFEVRLLSPIPEIIRCDPTRLRQILLNLLGNAVKFTARGSVGLFVRFVGRPSPTLVIDVIDTGIGMSEEQLTRLFRPFNQADASMSRRFGGTGLGLAICKLLAEALDGDIEAQSAPGEGSTFTLTLHVDVPERVPMVRSLGEAVPESAAPDQVARGRLRGTVLLAEDGPDNQVLISTILRQQGLSVVVAENGRLAVEHAQRALAQGAPFHVILMDMQMPELDGYSATRLLRGEGYRMPIVALTAHAMVGERERCLEAGCDEYLSKPIDRRALIAAIAGYVRPERPERSDPATTEIPMRSSDFPSVDAASTESDVGPLRSTLADPDMRELVARFVGSMPRFVESMERAGRSGSPDALRDLAHQLKGAAGGYGFGVITDAAELLESALRAPEPDPEQVRVLTDQLLRLCKRVST